MEEKHRFRAPLVGLAPGALTFALLLFCLPELSPLWRGVGMACAVAFTGGAFLFAAFGRTAWARSCLSCNVVALLIVLVLLGMQAAGLLSALGDVEALRAFVEQNGAWSYAVFVLLEILNIVVLPIPAFLIHMVGVALFGPVRAFFIIFASVLVGSYIAFALGRVCGKPVVRWCIGEAALDKYTRLLGNRGNLLFVMMQLLPFFPDDILCMVAGVSGMSWGFFTFAMLFTRPVYIGAVCFFGSGTVIPFSGWGIPVWIALFCLMGVLFFLFCRYEGPIEGALRRFADRLRRKK